jgi:hypothetical protein
VLTSVLAAGPLSTGALGPGRWLPLVAGSAAGALVLAGFVSTRTRSAWTMTLGFELLALAVGGVGLADGHYFPGAALSLVVIALLALPSGRVAFPATVTTKPLPVRLTPPPVVVARPAPPTFAPPGVLVSASVPPPPSFPPPPPGYAPPMGGSILPGR